MKSTDQELVAAQINNLIKPDITGDIVEFAALGLIAEAWAGTTSVEEAKEALDLIALESQRYVD